MFILKHEGFIIDTETFKVFQVDFDHNSHKPMNDKHSGTGFHNLSRTSCLSLPLLPDGK